MSHKYQIAAAVPAESGGLQIQWTMLVDAGSIREAVDAFYKQQPITGFPDFESITISRVS